MRRHVHHRVARAILVLAFVMGLVLVVAWWWSALESLTVTRRAVFAVAGKSGMSSTVLWIEQGRVHFDLQLRRVYSAELTAGESDTRWRFVRRDIRRGIRPMAAPALAQRLGVDWQWSHSSSTALMFPTTRTNIDVTQSFRTASLMVPIWLLLLPCAVVMTLAARRVRRPARRRGAGLCPACAYDTRATPGRCPECGFVDDAPTAAPVAAAVSTPATPSPGSGL